MKQLKQLAPATLAGLVLLLSACGASHFSHKNDIADLKVDKAICEVKAEEVVSDWQVAGESVVTGVITGIATGGLLILPMSPSETKQREAFQKCMREKGWSPCQKFGGC